MKVIMQPVLREHWLKCVSMEQGQCFASLLTSPFFFDVVYVPLYYIL